MLLWGLTVHCIRISLAAITTISLILVGCYLFYSWSTHQGSVAPPQRGVAPVAKRPIPTIILPWQKAKSGRAFVEAHGVIGPAFRASMTDTERDGAVFHQMSLSGLVQGVRRRAEVYSRIITDDDQHGLEILIETEVPLGIEITQATDIEIECRAVTSTMCGSCPTSLEAGTHRFIVRERPGRE